MPNLTQGYTVQTKLMLLISLKYLTIRGEEAGERGAGSKGELEITLNFRLLNNLSSSPLHPAPCPRSSSPHSPFMVLASVHLP